MTNVTECLKLYAADAEVSAEQFRSIMLDAAARDAVDAAGPRTDLIAAMIDDRLRAILGTLESLTEAIGLVDDIDTMRGEQIDALAHRIEGLARVIGSEVEHSRKAGL